MGPTDTRRSAQLPNAAAVAYPAAHPIDGDPSAATSGNADWMDDWESAWIDIGGEG